MLSPLIMAVGRTVNGNFTFLMIMTMDLVLLFYKHSEKATLNAFG